MCRSLKRVISKELENDWVARHNKAKEEYRWSYGWGWSSSWSSSWKTGSWRGDSCRGGEDAWGDEQDGLPEAADVDEDLDSASVRDWQPTRQTSASAGTGGATWRDKESDTKSVRSRSSLLEARHDDVLPDILQGWLFWMRAGFRREDRQTILGDAGNSLVRKDIV